MFAMGHVVNKQAWYTIDVNTDTGAIVVREDWQYIWKTDPTEPWIKPFTIAEKRAFHRIVDRQIWARWSHQFNLHAVGTAPLVKKFEGRTFPLTFDIRWVLHNPQWTVTVIRVAAKEIVSRNKRSQVFFPTRTITLYTHVLNPYETSNSIHETRGGIQPIPHELGHTFRNGDEYNAGDLFANDTDSIMNIGHQLRAHHIYSLLADLDHMVPGVTFTL